MHDESQKLFFDLRSVLQLFLEQSLGYKEVIWKELVCLQGNSPRKIPKYLKEVPGLSQVFIKQALNIVGEECIGLASIKVDSIPQQFLSTESVHGIRF
jgi:hypothetical protein